MITAYEPRASQLTQWLASPALTDPSGHCLSWHNPSHPGYAYPEITGLLLSYLSSTGGYRERRRELARALSAEPWSGVGRGEVHWYAFDTAMALGGLVATLEREDADSDPDPAWSGRLRRQAGTWATALVLAITDARAREPRVPLAEETRWSDSFGAHQSKLAVALVRYARWASSRGARLVATDVDLSVSSVLAAADRLIAPTLALCEPEGRFRIHSRSPMSYIHAHCYALEGLVAQTTRPTPTTAAAHVHEAIGAGTRWLADVQQPDGALLAWHDGQRAGGPPRTDATAQAVRLWLLADPDKYAEHIAAALAFLARMQDGGPGLVYQPGSADCNTWASIFTAQALTWRARGPEPTELV